MCLIEPPRSRVLRAIYLTLVLPYWKFFTDDVDARKTAQRLEVPVSGTIGILTYLVHKGHITLEDGNSMLRDMIKKGYYSPTDELNELLK